METLIEPLIEKAGQYARTSYELLKLKTLNKTADAASSILSRLGLLFVIFLFVLIANIGVCLWAGDFLGKNYYGFFAVAGFYAITGFILHLFHNRIKKRISNRIIEKALN
jgi:hypothetical protein